MEWIKWFGCLSLLNLTPIRNLLGKCSVNPAYVSLCVFHIYRNLNQSLILLTTNMKAHHVGTNSVRDYKNGLSCIVLRQYNSMKYVQWDLDNTPWQRHVSVVPCLRWALKAHVDLLKNNAIQIYHVIFIFHVVISQFVFFFNDCVDGVRPVSPIVPAVMLELTESKTLGGLSVQSNFACWTVLISTYVL